MFTLDRRAPDAVQVRRQLRRSQPRLPVAPVPLHPDRADQGRRRRPSTRRCRPRSSTPRTTSAPRSASTRRRARSTPTTASRPRRRCTAWSTSRCRRAPASIAGARVERFDQTVNTFDPFGLFVRTIEANLKNTDVFPAINFVQALGEQPEPAPELQHAPSTARSSASWRRSSSPTWSAAAPSAAIPSSARADSERRRALGDVPGRPQRSRDQRVLQALRQADRARRHRRRAADCHVPERRLGAQLRRRARSGLRARPRASSSTPTTPSSTRRSRCCRSSDGADVARASAGRPVEEPVQPHRRVRAAAASRPACWSTTPATASRTSAPTRRPTSSKRDARRSTWSSRSGSAALQLPRSAART